MADAQISRYGGLDLGSKQHPSHLVILERVRKGSYRQILSQWFDAPTTLHEVVTTSTQLCTSHGVEGLNYDATRGELQILKERRELPRQWRAVTFTVEEKRRLAGLLTLALERGELQILPDDRQKRQLLNVNQLLQAAETDDGHGDAFWSLALALDVAGYGRRKPSAADRYRAQRRTPTPSDVAGKHRGVSAATVYRNQGR